MGWVYNSVSESTCQGGGFEIQNILCQNPLEALRIHSDRCINDRSVLKYKIVYMCDNHVWFYLYVCVIKYKLIFSVR